jgi:FtsH-binding integral membrane protein
VRRSLLTTLVVGLLLGALTALGQQYLPDAVRSLANSSGPWCLVAFALAWRAPRGRPVVGALALAALLAGYVACSAVRGYPSSTALLLFWGLASVLVGPVLGVAAGWVRGTDGIRPALGAAVPAGVLVGEAVYGLTVVADSTSGGFWVAEGIVGLALVAVLAYRGRWSLTQVAVAAGGTVLLAAAFVLAYSNASLDLF